MKKKKMSATTTSSNNKQNNLVAKHAGKFNRAVVMVDRKKESKKHGRFLEPAYFS